MRQKWWDKIFSSHVGGKNNSQVNILQAYAPVELCKFQNTVIIVEKFIPKYIFEERQFYLTTYICTN
jgi:hypothetical protein